MRFARPYFRSAKKPAGGYFPDQVADAYGFPDVSASGYTVGLIELGGQYYATDLAQFCQSRSLAVPSVQVIQVNGAAISPDPGGADVEVALDVQVVVAAAPGASIRIYFADNSESGFAAAVAQALAECDTVSCSWGAPEDDWTADGMLGLSNAIEASSTPFFAASGDSGSSDGEKGKHVDYPASAAGSIACGGTSLPADAASNPNPALETAWSDSGGGLSVSFKRPPYQTNYLNLPGSARCVPDIAGCADPNTPYNIFANGQWQQVGGTSAVAPLFAALFVLLKAQNSSLLADVHGLLYQVGSCRDIVSGSNGAYSAGPGFDLVTGLGVPLPAVLLGQPAPVSPTPTPTPAPTPPPSSPPPAIPPSPPPPPPVSQPPVNVAAIQKTMAKLEANLASLQTLLSPLTD